METRIEPKIAAGIGGEYNHDHLDEEEIEVTVCVAALFSMPRGGVGVIGASDRMLTAHPDIQYEPYEQPKIYYLTNSIQIMTAGDSTMQAAILQRVESETNERMELEEERWLEVKEVAEMYVAAYLEEQKLQAEKEVLRPLGLDFESWIDRQLEMQPDLATELAKELYRFEPEHVSAIIAGVDPKGAHIYVVRRAQIFCQDKIGFAAIGVGKNHPSSELMFAGHSSRKLYPETLLLIHRAKKRAEAAPGVGKMTDMFFIGPPVGTFTRITPGMVEYLDEIFNTVEDEKKAISLRAEGQLNDFFKEAEERRTKELREQEQQQKAGIGAGGGEPPEQGDVSDESAASKSEDGQ